ncbi:CGNR zinc finger domain-containing protein [Agromyces bauzanensis]|uniref:Zinc finger CGNR domain-containing protein n=1 Tax=Agromyces bauzanensis TaxID=1308924 RepID=A0A917UW18_9MICO|nr:CGNR zinc finger domain-containing protein [Agromyces bauzanensis]GGJ88897.1 hypothetical protein GCM10011372_29350 [Agromyces bauzanensis]
MTSAPEPAHGEERWLTLAAVNTLVSGTFGSSDRVTDETALAAWVREHVPPAMPASAVRASREEFAAVCTAARELLSAIGMGAPLPAAALRRVNRAAAHPMHPAVNAARELQLTPARPVSPVAMLAADAVRLIASGDASRVRTCAAVDCDRMFLQDHRRRIWCSARCGTRMRARRRAARLRSQVAVPAQRRP